MDRRNDEKYAHCILKTALQWSRLGKLPNPSANGTLMWSNGYCNQAYRYFTEDEVHVASQEEMQAFKQPYIDRRKAAYQKRKKKREEEKEQAIREREIEIKAEEMRRLLQQAMELESVACENTSGGVVLDLETTGIAPEDEALEMSIIGLDGRILFHSYLKPYIKTEWISAQRVHGISPKMVEKAPYPHELLPIIKGILEGAEKIVGYNVDFDIGYLFQWGLSMENKTCVDVMSLFAPIYGDWNEEYEYYKWQTLSTCAAYYGYSFDAHGSLEDCKATLFCYNKIMKNNLSESLNQ